MFLISLTAISALGVIAGGAFWTAQAMYNVTHGPNNAVDTQFCLPATLPYTDPSTGALSGNSVTGFTSGSLALTLNMPNAQTQSLRYWVPLCP